MLKQTPSSLLSALLLAGLVPPVMAVDGVFEINQACALAGCFPGDTAGFPVTIDGSVGSSFRLTSDLAVSDANATVVIVTAESISLDLNGFAIRGPVTCGGFPLVCSPAGSSSGINAQSEGFSVSNGTIRGLAIGVLAGRSARVEGLTVLNNRTTGIGVGTDCIVADNIVRNNGGQGITSGGDSVVARNVVSANGGIGIFGDRSLLRDNVVRGNVGAGIDSFGSTLIGNTVSSNTGVGLNANSASGFGHNVFNNNNALGAQTASGQQIAPNVCGGDLICP